MIKPLLFDLNIKTKLHSESGIKSRGHFIQETGTGKIKSAKMRQTSQKIPLIVVLSIFVGSTRELEIFKPSGTRKPCEDLCGKQAYDYTTSGKLCTGTCDRQGSDYFWCSTKDGWDYCSVTENTDYKGHPCRDDHPCKKYGKSYTWCYNKKGSWGYCGLVHSVEEPKTLLRISSKHRSECRDECLYDEKEKYFWCNTDKGWDYCSPLPDTTYKNEPCRSDHSCGTHGYKYNWCWTNSEYDYCGVIRPGECKYSYTGNKENQSNVAMLSCTASYSGSNTETKFDTEPDPIEIADGSRWGREVTSLIARWHSGYLTEDPSFPVTTDNLRINLLGVVRKENLQYYQVEIHTKAEKSGRNSRLAQVLVPVGSSVPSRYVRTALAESFRRRARITLEVADYFESGSV
ncbi:uncharacterized protein Hap1MRO34_022433 [Clarias gariepinus]|uniref:uncharacterized protein LOC128508279 n=1 Tax=Clarias gariepinus TaxID=13013 RepID=UPI00234C5085|nr:uncharacterized protein LOC128508279 [Clarias gariepinus]